MSREPNPSDFYNTEELHITGLTPSMLATSIRYVYSILDAFDKTLLEQGEVRFASMLELANLSSIVGNLLGSGIAKTSQGIFQRNEPHKFPDLLTRHPNAQDIEIKVALETNLPKGHLAKPGCYLTCRYVLGDATGNYQAGKGYRGDVVWIWEIRFGLLEASDFNLSNTSGDSGKTAVVNATGMNKLATVYCDLAHCPYPKTGRVYGQYLKLSNSTS